MPGIVSPLDLRMAIPSPLVILAGADAGTVADDVSGQVVLRLHLIQPEDHPGS